MPSSAVNLPFFAKPPEFSKLIMLVSEKPVGRRLSFNVPLGFCATAPFDDESFEVGTAAWVAFRFLEGCWVTAELAAEEDNVAAPAWLC